MPNVNIDVYANTHGAPKDLKEVSGGLEELDKKGGGAGIGLSGLWKQFAVGQIAADALKKAVGAVTDFMKDAIGASAQQELAERNLADALLTTGRNVDSILPGLKEHANQIQQDTIYTDDAVLSAHALMAQLSDLDEQGLKKATESAIGMASVFKIDLQSAATSVAKAMAGNYELLGRYLPDLRKLKTEEEKHAFVMQEMAKWYERAKGETETFSGSLKQLGNMWDEIKEAVGRAITENENIRDLIDRIKGGIIDLIESGKLEEWVESLSVSISSLIKIFEGLYTAIKTVVDLAEKLPSIHKAGSKIYKEAMEEIKNATEEGRRKVKEFHDSLEVLQIPLKEIDEEARKGPENWAKYTKEMRALDEAMVAGRPTVESWVDKAAEFLGLIEKTPEKVDKEAGAIDKETKAVKEKITVLKTAISAHRNFLNIVAQAPALFEDEAYALATLAPPARDLNDVLALTPTYMQDIAYAIGTTAEDGKNWFDGLYNDIAKGFGDVVSNIKLGNEGLEIDFKALFSTVGEAFKRMIGEMVAEKVLGLFKNLFSNIGKAATDTMTNTASSAVSAVTGITQGAAGAISGLWTGLGAAVGSFLGTLLGNILGGGKGYGEITYWLKPIWENTQIISNRLANEYTDWMTELCVGKNRLIEQQDYHSSLMEHMVEHLDAIRSSLSSVTSAQMGFEGQVARQTLFLTHPGEYVRITPPNTPSVQAARGETSIVSNIEAQVYIKPVVIKHDDGYLIDFIQEKIEYVKKQYDRGNWKIPITSVGGA